MDLALDPDTGDLALTGGRLQTVTGAAEVTQRLRLALGVHTGEWLLDTSFGVDWLGKVLGKGRSKPRVDAEIKRAILATPGVTRLTAYTSTITGRSLAVNFTVATAADELLDATITQGTGEGDAIGAELFLAILPRRRRAA